MSMSVSLCITTFLMPFLIWGTIFATQIIASPSSSLYVQNPGSDHKIRKVGEIKPSSSTETLWSERENEMENQLGHQKTEIKVGSMRGRTLEIAAGSGLPDCLHACGSCSPCTLVMVSLACGSHIDDAESCPVSYRCMCKSKSYPVP